MNGSADRKNELRVAEERVGLGARLLKGGRHCRRHVICQALLKHNIPVAFVSLLAGLHDNKSANVRPDELSRHFTLKRGTKQAERFSFLLFRALLQDIVDEVRPKCLRLDHRLQLGLRQEHLLSSLRFAVCLLLAYSAIKLGRRTETFAIAAKRRGFEMHPLKTKALSNAERTEAPKADNAEMRGPGY